jgi:hypothetical protein
LDGSVARLSGDDIVEVYGKFEGRTLGAAKSYFVFLRLCGDARGVYGDTYRIDLEVCSTWANTAAGMAQALTDLAHIPRASVSTSASITLTGAVTGTGTGSVVTTLAPTGVTAGDYTNANIRVDAYGRITLASDGAGGGGMTSLTGDVTGAGSGAVAATIANDAVTNAKAANMAQATLKGRAAGAGTGDPTDLTADQARTAMGLGTAATLNSGTGAGDLPTITQADARYQLLPTINDQSGTTYTFVLADAGKTIRTSNGSAVTLTIPTNASVAYPIGTMIRIIQSGAGQVTIAPDGGVIMNSYGSATKTAGQYASAILQKVATDTWNLDGTVS